MAINFEEEEFGLQLPNQGGITDVAFKSGSALDRQINKLNQLEQLGFPQPNLQNLKEMDMKQFQETGTPLSLPEDQYAMAISNYDQLFGPRTMTDANQSLYTGMMDQSGFPVNYTDRMRQQNLPGFAYEPKESLRSIINSQLQNAKTKTGQGLSFLRDKLGDVYGKTQELGSRFKEGAAPVFGLASMIGNATNPLNPDAFNYNPDLAAQLNFMDENFGGSMVNNPSSGLLQYAPGTPLEGQNVMSLFGSNDPVKQLEKQLARRQKTYDNLGNQWSSLEGLNIDPNTGLDDLDRKKQTYFDKFLNPTTSWLGKVKADQKVRIDKRNVALAIKEAQKEARKESNQNQSSTINYGKKQGTTGSWTPGGTYTAPAPQRDYSKHSAYGLKDGGLVSLFTRRG